MAKPLRWKVGDPSFEGTAWAVKNLFELKNARRVLVEGNVFERNWTHAQNGFAILFTVRNQDGGAPWSAIEDVTFVNNIVRHAGGGVNVLGRDDNHPSQQTRRLEIRNNVFLDVGGSWGAGRLFQLLDGTSNVRSRTTRRCRRAASCSAAITRRMPRFVFQNNIAPHNEHGITGSGTESGTQTLARYFPRAVVRGNVIVGGNAGRYPPDNAFPGSLDEAGIARAAHAASCAPTSTRSGHRRARQRWTPAGADIAQLLRAVNGVAPLERGETHASRRRRFADRARLCCGARASSLFWMAVGLLAYVYAGYPLVAAVRARLRPRPVARAVERRWHPATIPFPDAACGCPGPDRFDRRRRLQRGVARSKPASRTCWRWTTRPAGWRSSSAPTAPPTTRSSAHVATSHAASVSRRSTAEAASRRC